MALGRFMSIIDKVLLEISRVIEAIIDGIEYRIAKAASGRAAKQTSSKYWSEDNVRIEKLKRTDGENLS
jgi:hypothetical protein